MSRRAILSDRTKVYERKSQQSPGLTLPNESMSIPYLLARYVKGVPLGVQERHPVNHPTDNFDSPDWEKVKHMDMVDHEEFREELAQIDQVHKEQAARRKARKVAESNVPKNPPEADNAEARADRPAGDGAAAPA